MKMLLEGISFCHQHFVIHRDLKPANLLISNDGQLKLGDFGLARKFSSPTSLTNDVNTRWYKPPELLLGARYYAAGVDNWAIGCIFAELLLRKPLFPGTTDVEQLQLIFNV